MKKIFQLMTLISLVYSPLGWTAAAQTSLDPEAEKIKDEISRYSRLPIRKIAVRLKGGAKLTGLPTDVEDETFVLVERKTGRQTVIKYTEVSKVNKTGMTDNEKKFLLFGSVAAAGVLLIIFKPKPKPCDLRRLFC